MQQIRARSTVILTNDNITMIVLNTKFIDSPVTNWTYGDPRVRFRIPVGVAYGGNLDKVRDALIEVAREDSDVLDEPEPTGIFGDVRGKLDQFGTGSWSREMSYRPRRFRSDLNFAIARKLRKAGIEIPYPQRDVNLRDKYRAR